MADASRGPMPRQHLDTTKRVLGHGLGAPVGWPVQEDEIGAGAQHPRLGDRDSGECHVRFLADDGAEHAPARIVANAVSEGRIACDEENRAIAVLLARDTRFVGRAPLARLGEAGGVEGTPPRTLPGISEEARVRTARIMPQLHDLAVDGGQVAVERAEPPENPMSADRVRWEHIQRVYEMCERNVSETARRLNMHRRTLQRILAKRAPR